MKIFTFWRSLATYRVRMALNLKGLRPEQIEVDLHAGAQLKPAFAAINPMRAIPVLIDDDGSSLQQSLPIIEYLDERYPDPALMPADAAGRARVRALAQITVADSHPLIVPRVRADLASRFGATPEQVNAWARYWLGAGLDAYEHMLARDKSTGEFCHGDRIGLADICLVSHAAGVRFFEGTIDRHPTVKRIVERCQADARIAAAHPLKQPGAPKSM
jgi:maleylacetoacetate isomerase